MCGRDDGSRHIAVVLVRHDDLTEPKIRQAEVSVETNETIGGLNVVVNDLPLGRNVAELLRIIDALQFHEKHGEVCPANWKSGDAAMTATPDGVAAYLAEHSDKL